MVTSTAAARSLARAAGVLFAFSVLLYVLGVLQIYVHVCEHIGATIAMAGIALGICGAALLATFTVVTRTAASWFTLAGVLLLLASMYLAVGTIAPRGCSVV
jgi:membrane-bound ClpP family serine protease